MTRYDKKYLCKGLDLREVALWAKGRIETKRKYGMSKIVESYSTEKSKVRPLRDLATQILDTLEGDVGPWRKPWDANMSLIQISPFNFASSRKYSGIVNVMNLKNKMEAIAAETKNLDTDPRFMTFNQYKQISKSNSKLQMLKGAKGTPVFVPIIKNIEIKEEKDDDVGMSSLLKIDGEQDSSNTSDEKLTKKICVGFRQVHVFNGMYFKGLPKFDVLPEEVAAMKEAIYSSLEHVIESLDLSISHGGEKAFYRPGQDHVQMPPIEAFSNTDCYVACLLHEIAHATGSPNRLDRFSHTKEFIDKYNVDDKEKTLYAFEELVADMASVQTCIQLGMQPLALENHDSYIKSWLNPLKENIPEREKLIEIVEKALKMSDFASNYIMKHCGEFVANVVDQICEKHQIKDMSVNTNFQQKKNPAISM